MLRYSTKSWLFTSEFFSSINNIIIIDNLHTLWGKAFRGTVVKQAMLTLNGGSLEITRTVPLKYNVHWDTLYAYFIWEGGV